MSAKKIHLIAAARPNFMKVAPFYHALVAETGFMPQIVHTGQHYDTNMSGTFFVDLRLPEPTHHLEIGSGTHAEQTGRTMIAYEALCQSERPDALVVVGDVNATAACALVGAKLQIPVVHLEAGLRSRDRRMPEEINRLVTDAISDLLWTPSEDADENLRAEGVPAHRIVRIGNIMIDSFEMMRRAIEGARLQGPLAELRAPYAVATLHRPSNVDDRTRLGQLVEALQEVAKRMTVVFAIHPRTRRRLQEFGLSDSLLSNRRILTTEPLGYIDFMHLVTRCTIAITDSGGVQEETTYLGIPCVTLRENTERPITLTQGTNRLIEPPDLPPAAQQALEGSWTRGIRPDGWDGRASERAVESIKRLLL